MGPSRAAPAFVVEATGEHSGHCDCCGTTTRCVWGFVDRAEATIAAYWVRWTTAHLDEYGAAVDMVLGASGDTSSAEDRAAISLIYRRHDGAWAFMVVDADAERYRGVDLAGSSLRRDEVIGTLLAAQVFAIVDAVFAQDLRLFR